MRVGSGCACRKSNPDIFVMQSAEDWAAKNTCACRNSNSHVQMMKSAEKWRRQNATNGMYCSRRRRVLVDRKVRASVVIVGRVRSQQMAEMPLAEHDNVVQTFPPDRTDRPFAISVLPRRSRRGWPIPNAHRPKAADEDVTVGLAKLISRMS